MLLRSALVALVLTSGGVAGISAQEAGPPAAAAPKGPLNTLRELGSAITGCWQWPPGDQIQTGMELTVMLSFKRGGEIFGGRITYQSRYVSEKERALYYEALAQALRLCSPLPVTESLGHAMAGRMFIFRYRIPEAFCHRQGRT